MMQQAAMQQAAMQQAAAAQAAQLAQQQEAMQKDMRADAPEFHFEPAAQQSPAPPKVWTILDPKTNRPIDAHHAHQDFSPPKKTDPKVMTIVDPKSGEKISAVDFAAPKDTASFTITDPQSGTAIKV